MIFALCCTMDEQDSLHQHFRFIRNILTWLDLFVYKEELSQSRNSYHTYYFSKLLFIKSCVLFYGFFITTFHAYMFSLTVTPTALFVIDFVYGLFSFFFVYFERQRFLDLLFEIDVFDKVKLVCKHQRQPTHNTKYGKISGLVFLSVFFFLAIVVVLVTFYSFKQTFWIFTNLQLRSITACQILLSNVLSFRFSVLFIFFSYEIAIRYRNLNTKIVLAIDDALDGRKEAVLDRYRLLYFQLSRIQNKFNKYFGIAITIFFCHAYLRIICLFMQILSQVFLLYSIVFILKNFIEIYVVVKFAELIKKEVSNPV